MTLNQALISATTLTNSTTTSVTIPVPSGYTDLRVVMSTRAASGGPTDVSAEFNGDTTSGNYQSIQLTSNGSTVASNVIGKQIGVSTGSSDTALTFASGEFYIANYASSTAKSIAVDGVTENNATTAYISLRANRWSGTAAISSIRIFNDSGAAFAVGSEFTVYGVTKLGVTPTLTPKASGGDIIKNDGTYWYHAFLSTGAFVPQQALTADIFQVAGGGAGGASYSAGGGGAGGVLTFTSQVLSPTSYTCAVGAGGASFIGNYNTENTNSGTNSRFGSLDPSIGGGAGGIPTTYKAGKNGGSGGGSVDEGTPGTGTSGQGNAGGMGASGVSGTGAGAGGGGWGSAGSNSSVNNSGAAGAGNYSALTNSAGALLGVGQLSGGNYYFAGGGGGGCESTGGNPSAGGVGGGGAGSKTSNAINGTANTGGGGGGAGRGSNGGFPDSGAGGSGIIIVRYAMA